MTDSNQGQRMKTLTMSVLCALFMMTGCMAEDLGHDVASQESAVESAPAPEPTEDMQRIRDTCLFSCGDVWRSAGLACDNTYPFAPHMSCSGQPSAIEYCNHYDHLWAQCQQDAGQSFGACGNMCDVIFGGSTNGGSHLPGNSPLVGETPNPTPEEHMQIIRDACEAKCDIGGTVCHNNCRPSDGSWCDANCEGDQDICRGQCGVDFPGVTAPDDSSSDAINDNDSHLPGSCTNPVACGTTTGTDPMGQGGGSGTHPVEYCTGCVCTANPTTCDSCVRRCLHRREICLYNGGGSNCGTGGDCNTECDADNLVCACPTQPH